MQFGVKLTSPKAEVKHVIEVFKNGVDNVENRDVNDSSRNNLT
jgi:hypothetical protein